jgi:hypothetical protein
MHFTLVNLKLWYLQDAEENLIEMPGKIIFTYHYFPELSETERNGYLVVLALSILIP